MVWGKSTPKAPPRPRSALVKVLPLLILLVFVLIFAFVGYQLYLTAQRISSATSDKMHEKNVVFTKEGLKVGVKEIKNENYVDKTQSILVKAWNLSTWPEYRSRLGWNNTTGASGSGGKAEARKPYSRSSSSSTK